MKTTIAIAMWNGHVSTTLDFARLLMVADVDGARELSRKTVNLCDERAERRASSIREQGVQIILCGAVSAQLARAVSQMGIQLYPHLTGPVDDVLAAFLCDRLTDPRFLLAGSAPWARRKWRHRQAGGGQCREGRTDGRTGPDHRLACRRRLTEQIIKPNEGAD